MEHVGAKPSRTFTMKSSVADSHARTVAALHAPDVPSEVNNFQTYFIGVSESIFSPFFPLAPPRCRLFKVLAGLADHSSIALQPFAWVLLPMGKLPLPLLAATYPSATDRHHFPPSSSYDTGFFGGTIALQSFRTAFGITKENSSNASANLVSLFQAGSFFGAGLQLPMTTRFGRKWSIIISNLIFIVSAIVQTFANGSVGTMMGGEERDLKVARAEADRVPSCCAVPPGPQVVSSEVSPSVSRPWLSRCTCPSSLLPPSVVGSVSLAWIVSSSSSSFSSSFSSSVSSSFSSSSSSSFPLQCLQSQQADPSSSSQWA